MKGDALRRGDWQIETDPGDALPFLLRTDDAETMEAFSTWMTAEQMQDLAHVAAKAASLLMLDADAALEPLAALEHERWSHWMAYMLDCGTVTVDGVWTMPKDKYWRWKRQMETAYTELSEPEKESDRDEARKTLAILARLTETSTEATP